MNRIESNVGTQAGDIIRPRQTAEDLRHQAAAAGEASAKDADKLADTPISADEMRAVAASLQQVVQIATGRNLEFSVDQATDSMFVVVKDGETDEVIKQIPPEEVLQLRAHFQDLIGLFVDKTA